MTWKLDIEKVSRRVLCVGTHVLWRPVTLARALLAHGARSAVGSSAGRRGGISQSASGRRPTLDADEICPPTGARCSVSTIDTRS